MSSSLLGTVGSLLLVAQQVPTVEQVEPGLVIEWRKKHIQAHPRQLVFSEGVKATYGVTTIFADRITLFLEGPERRGLAEGDVRIVDPDGNAHAKCLEFDWVNKRGKGDQVEVHVKNLKLVADRFAIQPNEWLLEKVYATPCDETKPLLGLKADSARVSPGRRIDFKGAEFLLFGSRMVKLSSYRVNLTKQGPGIRIPRISYRQGDGFGMAWNSGFAFNDTTALDVGFSAFPRNPASAKAELGFSLLRPSESNGATLPRSEMAERGSFGYFDNVYVKSPGDERAYVGGRRMLVSFGSQWNLGPVARKATPLFTKSFDVALEDGRTMGGFGVATQVRAQTIRDRASNSDFRTLGNLVVIAPPVKLAEGLYTSVRGMAEGVLDRRSQFGWLQGQAGLVWRPNSRTRFGAAYVLAHESGTARFVSDQLISTHALHIRSDLKLGPTTLGVLAKYDFNRRDLYDVEVGLAQVAGCIEPYFIYRKFPRSFSFGVRLRLDDVIEAFERRTGKKRREAEPGD